MISYIKLNQLNMTNIPGSSVTLSVDKGEIIGITGTNGSGKSTLARYLAGIDRPDVIGKILINGLDPFSELDLAKIRRMVGIVFQDPREGKVFETVGRDMAFGAENLGVSKERIQKRFSYYIKNYNLRQKQSKTYDSISGSEEQRVALAGMMIMRNDIIILDEAFSMQNTEDTKRYVKMIISSARRRGQTVIIFSKQREVLEMVDRAFEMVNGGLYEIDVDGMPRERVWIDSSAAKNKAKGETFVDMNRKISVSRYIYGGDSKSENGISLHNISFGYDSSLIIDNVNVRYEAGSAYRILGPHGSGKTTYLQLIAGLLKPYEGEIFIGDNKKIGYVFQYSEDGFVENTVLDDVMFGPMSEGYSKREAREMASSILNFVGVKETLWGRSPLELSFGEKRLVSIAGALALNPDFLLIDEPYVGLDYNSKKHMENIIEGLCREGKCIITVEG